MIEIRLLLITGVFYFFSFSAEAKFLQDSLREHYIKTYERQFFIGPVIKQRTIAFQLKNRYKADRITFRPNNSYSAGLRLNIFGIGMELTYAIPLATRNKERYGLTDVTEFSFNSVSRQWLADFYWQRYTGFYFERSWQPLGINDPHPLASDLGVINTGFSYTYIFNHRKFSIRSPYQFTEHQNQSGGSFLLGLVFHRFKVFSDTSIVLPNDQVYFKEGVDSKALDFVDLSIMPGYSYNFIYKNYFLNLTVSGGPSHYWINYDPYVGGRRYDIDLNLAGSFRAAIGYNGDRYFAGLSYHVQGHRAFYQETKFTSSLSSFRLTAGIRFKEKGFLTKRPSDIIQLKKLIR